MKPRLLYISADYSPAQSAAAVRAKFHVEALLTIGHTVEVLTCGEKAGQTTLPCSPGRLSSVPARLASNQARLLIRLLAEFKVGLYFAAFALRNRRRFDCAVLSSPPFFANWVVAAALFLLRRPYVLDIRDRYPQVLFSVGVLRADSLLGRALRWAERWMYAKAAVLATVTHTLAAEIEKDCGHKPHVIRNGYDASEYDAVRRNAASPAQPPMVLMHGLFGQLFDAQAFIGIAKHCLAHAPTHSFVLAGYGPKLNTVLDLKLPNVRYVGHITHQEVLVWLERATLGISVHTNQPSTMAGFAVKIFEFIGAGLPCIVIPRGESGLEVERQGLGWAFDNTDWLSAGKTIVSVLDGSLSVSRVQEAVLAERATYARQTQAAAFAQTVSSAISL